MEEHYEGMIHSLLTGDLVECLSHNELKFLLDMQDVGDNLNLIQQEKIEDIYERYS